MTTEQRAILERLNNHVFDVLSTNYGVPARVLNAALADAMRRVEAEYLPPCARCGAVGTNVAPGYAIVAGGVAIVARSAEDVTAVLAEAGLL